MCLLPVSCGLSVLCCAVHNRSDAHDMLVTVARCLSASTNCIIDNRSWCLYKLCCMTLRCWPHNRGFLVSAAAIAYSAASSFIFVAAGATSWRHPSCWRDSNSVSQVLPPRGRGLHQDSGLRGCQPAAWHARPYSAAGGDGATPLVPL